MPEPILQQPAAIFLTIMAVILIAPLLSESIHLPGIVGLILGGMVIGRYGLNLLVTGPTIELFGAVGLIYLMFNAGLEIDLDQFARVRRKAIIFAAISFSLPQLSGIGLGRALGLDWAGAILLGATYASQTLIAYPVLSRLGIIRNDAVAITVGATIFTDIAALLVLGVITGSQQGSVSVLGVAKLIGLTIAYAALILLVVPRLGKLFFRRFSGRAVEFQFVLVVLFVAAVLAEQINLHTIVGAFLAGLAINSTLSEHSRVVGHVRLLGESLFVPLFMVTVGMRLDPIAVVTDWRTLATGAALTAAVYSTKFVASWLTGRIYGFSRDELLTTWGLSQAQAAATLATVLVGQQAGLFPRSVFDGAILMVLLTSISSPILVNHFGARLSPTKEEPEEQPAFKKILIPITRAELPRHLLDLAALLAHTQEGILVPLVVGEEEAGVQERQDKLDSQGLVYPETDIQIMRRIDSPLQRGIVHVAQEEDVSMILLDWQAEGTGDSIFDQTTDQVLWSARVPVLVARLTSSVNGVERLVLVIAARTVGVKLDERALETVEAMAEALDVPLLVWATSHYVDQMEKRWAGEEDERQVRRLGEDIVGEVTQELGEGDLLILPTMGSQARFQRNQGRIPEALITAVDNSVAVLHHP